MKANKFVLGFIFLSGLAHASFEKFPAYVACTYRANPLQAAACKYDRGFPIGGRAEDLNYDQDSIIAWTCKDKAACIEHTYEKSLKKTKIAYDHHAFTVDGEFIGTVMENLSHKQGFLWAPADLTLKQNNTVYPAVVSFDVDEAKNTLSLTALQAEDQSFTFSILDTAFEAIIKDARFNKPVKTALINIDLKTGEAKKQIPLSRVFVNKTVKLYEGANVHLHSVNVEENGNVTAFYPAQGISVPVTCRGTTNVVRLSHQNKHEILVHATTGEKSLALEIETGATMKCGKNSYRLDTRHPLRLNKKGEVQKFGSKKRFSDGYHVIDVSNLR